MNRALFSGLSSTVAQQTRLDVAANNLANVSTVGFKASRTNFKDTYYSTLKSGMAPTKDCGGVSPMQIGAGVAVGSISMINTQGTLQSTGQVLDAAIDGSGMFIVNGPTGSNYTRDGSFVLDETNTLVLSSNGMAVQGWLATDGTVTASGTVTNLSFPLRSMRSPRATSMVDIEGNLPSDATATSAPITSTATIYDALGESHTLELSYTHGATALEWTVDATLEGTTVSRTITFADDGTLPAGTTLDLTGIALPSGATAMGMTIDLSKITQYASGDKPTATSQDGYGAASLENVAITDGGMVQGNYSDGRSMILGQVALATFANDVGLDRSGTNLFSSSAASGVAYIGAPATEGRGTIVGSTQEMSNSDLTSSFLEMLTTQRAYQASTRVISTANSLLEEAIQLVGR